MRAIVLTEHGGPEVLRIDEIPDPVPGTEEILVDVAATAVNRADVLQRMGLYPDPRHGAVHEVPGLEFAGTVAELGPGASRWEIGDSVMGIVAGGGYAEKVVVHERQAMRVPASVGLPDAGAIPEVWITAWDALVLQGGLRPDGRALVHAGASGVGTAAIQICRSMGVEVAVTASSGKVDACREIGAGIAIDYEQSDFVEEVSRWTGGRGVDTVLDVVGGDYLDRNLDCVAVGGSIVQVGVMGGGKATLALGKMLPKRARLVGTVLRSRPIEEKIAVTQQFSREVLPLFDRDQAVPVIDSRYALDSVAEAHARMEANANVGKILVEIG